MLLPPLFRCLYESFELHWKLLLSTRSANVGVRASALLALSALLSPSPRVQPSTFLQSLNTKEEANRGNNQTEEPRRDREKPHRRFSPSDLAAFVSFADFVESVQLPSASRLSLGSWPAACRSVLLDESVGFVCSAIRRRNAAAAAAGVVSLDESSRRLNMMFHQSANQNYESDSGNGKKNNKQREEQQQEQRQQERTCGQQEQCQLEQSVPLLSQFDPIFHLLVSCSKDDASAAAPAAALSAAAEAPADPAAAAAAPCTGGSVLSLPYWRTELCDSVAAALEQFFGQAAVEVACLRVCAALCFHSAAVALRCVAGNRPLLRRLHLLTRSLTSGTPEHERRRVLVLSGGGRLRGQRAAETGGLWRGRQQQVQSGAVCDSSSAPGPRAGARRVREVNGAAADERRRSSVDESAAAEDQQSGRAAAAEGSVKRALLQLVYALGAGGGREALRPLFGFDDGMGVVVLLRQCLMEEWQQPQQARKTSAIPGGKENSWHSGTVPNNVCSNMSDEFYANKQNKDSSAAKTESQKSTDDILLRIWGPAAGTAATVPVEITEVNSEGFECTETDQSSHDGQNFTGKLEVPTTPAAVVAAEAAAAAFSPLVEACRVEALKVLRLFAAEGLWREDQQSMFETFLCWVKDVSVNDFNSSRHSNSHSNSSRHSSSSSHSEVDSGDSRNDFVSEKDEIRFYHLSVMNELVTYVWSSMLPYRDDQHWLHSDDYDDGNFDSEGNSRKHTRRRSSNSPCNPPSVESRSDDCGDYDGYDQSETCPSDLSVSLKINRQFSHKSSFVFSNLRLSFVCLSATLLLLSCCSCCSSL